MKILGILVEDNSGRVSLLRVESERPEVGYSMGGVVDNPSPKEVRYQEAVKVKEANVDTILDKYKEEE